MLSQRQLWENDNGGLCVNGEAFNDLKWREVMLMYEQINNFFWKIHPARDWDMLKS